jgi:hypothetical protein
MKKTIKHIDFLCLALCLTFILVNCSFIENSIFHKQLIMENAAPDGNNQHESAQTFGFGDDLIASNTKIKPGNRPTAFEIIPSINFQVRNNYSETIWQPPRIS